MARKSDENDHENEALILVSWRMYEAEIVHSVLYCIIKADETKQLSVHLLGHNPSNLVCLCANTVPFQHYA